MMRSSTPGKVPRYKSTAIFPASDDMDLFHSNQTTMRPPCENCFPVEGCAHDNYVDLLEFSNFCGKPYPLADGVAPPTRFLADLRYVVVTPLPHTYPSVFRDVIYSKRVTVVLNRVLNGAGVSGDQVPSTRMSLQNKVLSYYCEIRAILSRAVCKVCAYALYKIFRRLMTNLLVSPKQMQRLQHAEQSGIPLVYLPLHRSHVDYLMITWNAWHWGLQLPHIASGDNLNLSGFGWLLRATGAFFIRRRVDPSDDSGRDALYRAVLHSYIEQLLKKKLPIEFFLEGTRSRFGKSLIPKHGLISNVVEAVQQETIKDCYLVSVSYTYDQVAEGIFVNELMGVPKVRESVWSTFKGVLQGFGVPKKCGAVRLHFGKPVLLSDYLKAMHSVLARRGAPSQLARLPHSHSYRELIPWHHEHTERVDNRSLIRAIGYHILYEAQAMMSISVVSVISALLLAKHRQGVSRVELEADAEWLCEVIVNDNREVMGYRQGSTKGCALVTYAMRFIGESVDCEISAHGTQRIVPFKDHMSLICLAYNRNVLLPMFGIRAAIGMALLCREDDYVPVSDIIEDATSICDWLQFEAIFVRPCEDLRDKVSKELEAGHRRHGLLTLDCDRSDGWGGDADNYIKIRTGKSWTYEFYANILRPFLQSLCITLDRLKHIEGAIKETLFIRELCVSALKEQLDMDFELYVEAINSDSFKNAVRVLRHKGILAADEVNVQPAVTQCIPEVRANILRILTVHDQWNNVS